MDLLPRTPPEDQADGLRRLFARSRAQVIAVASNPHLQHGGLMLERLASALGELGRHTLVVDAGERSPSPHELAAVDLAACIETLSRDVSYLAARHLALRWVDAAGSTRGFLAALADAAPQAAVLLIHAPALDLSRLLGPRPGAAVGPGALEPAARGPMPRPVLLADDHPASVTHAYASMKLLVQRAGLWAFDLVLATAHDSPRARVIPRHLARCAEDFLGATVAHAARVDIEVPPQAPASTDLRRLVAGHLDTARLDAGYGAPARAAEGSAAALFESLADEPAAPAAWPAVSPAVPPSVPPSNRSRHAFPEF